MATHQWGGAKSRATTMRGLRTRYEHGHISQGAYIRALRREADYLDEHNRTSLLYSYLDAQRASAYRAKADVLEQAQKEGDA